MNLCARFFRRFGKLSEIFIEMKQRFVFDRPRPIAQAFPIFNRRDRRFPPFAKVSARLRSAPRSCVSLRAARAFWSKVSAVKCSILL